MTGFIQGADRNQGYLLPERIDEYVSEENPVRVIEAFVEELDLGKLGFSRVEPNEMGRPAYCPATLLKIYLYGYLNRIQSSRRLEQEAKRNLELMWLTGRLAPDFKTLADFRADNGGAIRGVCREFIVLCRRLGMFSQAVVAIDGSKFKAVNHRDRNFTSGKMQMRMQLIEQSITEYLEQLDRMDRKEAPRSVRKAVRLKERIATLKDEMRRLAGLQKQMKASADGQLSLTDPDARSMASQGKGTGVVGYNVQTAVDAEHHLIVTHEVTNVGSDRDQLYKMAEKAREAMGTEELTVVADRGYFKSEEILACDEAGIVPIVPKSMTSTAAFAGRFDREAFRYVPRLDETHDDDRTGPHVLPLLELELRLLPPQSALHARDRATCDTLGARGCARHDAKTLRSRSKENADPPPNRRTSVRNTQGLDGGDPLPHTHARTGQYRDESSRLGLQSKTNDEDHGNQIADRSDASLKTTRPLFPARSNE